MDLAAAEHRYADHPGPSAPPQHGLSSDKMALITSDRGEMRIPAHQMALNTSGCHRRADHPGRRPAQLTTFRGYQGHHVG